MDVLARNNVKILGRGEETIVFAHGFATEQSMWRFIVPVFEEDYRIVLFDYVGAGGADIRAYSPERYESLDGYASDVLEICAALDLRGATLIAHSVSGMIGVRAAIAAPERFKRLVMIGASARYVDEPPDYIGGFSRADIDGLLDMMESNYLAWAATLAPTVMKNADRPELYRELEQSFCATDRGVARRFAAASFLSDSRTLLPKVHTPSLLLQSADDVIVPLQAAEYLRQRLTESTLRLLNATGHYPQLSDPEEAAYIIRRWLQDQPDA